MLDPHDEMITAAGPVLVPHRGRGGGAGVRRRARPYEGRTRSRDDRRDGYDRRNGHDGYGGYGGGVAEQPACRTEEQCHALPNAPQPPGRCAAPAAAPAEGLCPEAGLPSTVGADW
ncbi:hypothetical protein GCM10020256_38970 [Streptomyces thermocoprophilus]